MGVDPIAFSGSFGLRESYSTGDRQAWRTYWRLSENRLYLLLIRGLGPCCGLTLATEKLAKKLRGDFPRCLDAAPILLPSSGSQPRAGIDQWLNKLRIHPRMIAEFDNSALMKAFGQKGAGIFVAPAAIKAAVARQYQVTAIGQVVEVKERFFAISVERRVLHPVVSIVVEAARKLLFADE